MDKGACNSINSKIQMWPPSTIKSNFIKFLITPVDYYKFILQFGSLTFEASLAFVTQHDEMVVNSVDPKDDVTNYIHQ